MNTTRIMLEVVEPLLAKGWWVTLYAMPSGKCVAEGGPIHGNDFHEIAWNGVVRENGDVSQSHWRT